MSPSWSSAGLAPSFMASSSRPGCGSITYGWAPAASSDWQTSWPWEPAPTTRQSAPTGTSALRTAVWATTSGSTQARATSGQLGEIGQV